MSSLTGPPFLHVAVDLNHGNCSDGIAAGGLVAGTLDLAQACAEQGIRHVEAHELDLDEALLPAGKADGAWSRWVFSFVQRPRDLGRDFQRFLCLLPFGDVAGGSGDRLNIP